MKNTNFTKEEIEKGMEKGKQSLQHITLTSHEKGDILSNLIAYADENPIDIACEIADDKSILKSQHTSTPSHKSPYGRFINRFAAHRYTFASLAAVLVIVLLGGSAAYAAADSLPGDLLYPIKINITEPIVGVLKTSKQAKTEWAGEKAVRRLEEANVLAKQGRLDETKREKIEKEFDKNATIFRKNKDKESEGEDKVIGKEMTENENIKIIRNVEGIDEDQEDKSDNKIEKKINDQIEKINQRQESSSKEQKRQIENLGKHIKSGWAKGRDK